MGFFSRMFGFEALTAAVRESSNKMDTATQSLRLSGEKSDASLQTIAQTLAIRETPEMIRGAICSALQESNLSNALITTRDQLETVGASLKNSASHPIPVQTFPVIDDIRFEAEKQKAALESARHFVAIGKEFIDKLDEAHRPVDDKLKKLFSSIDKYAEDRSKQDGDPKSANLTEAMQDLLDCSPKRVIAAFQKHSLEAGVAFVREFNCLIDELARQYPPCRGGIYASRLNYSDVIQISEEIIATLRTTSTILDDVQASATAHSGGPFTEGTILNQRGSIPFSFTNTPFGLTGNMAGKLYSLRPDFISQIPLGKSWSVFANGSPVGSIGLNSIMNSVGSQGLSSSLTTGLASVLRSQGLL